MSPIPGDVWATREFHIKWRRWSFIHTSWDNLVTLSQLAGYKRVTNYMKRADEAEVCLPENHPRCYGRSELHSSAAGATAVVACLGIPSA